MARLQGRTLFFITSPRTPMKMIPEIELLVQKFDGKVWNPATQEDFMKALADDPSFEGHGSPKDLAFSARDRINRGPKALGFVNLKPTISISDAGKMFLDEETSEEALLSNSRLKKCWKKESKERKKKGSNNRKNVRQRRAQALFLFNI